ncbi:MAG: hypothetical protein R3181_10235 [Rubricoccaceae bacterium]|nr:hypothetical protein [Rubricoccaceae bacterium]
MPQYELDAVGPARFSGRRRGRTPEEAARRAGQVPDASALAVAPEADREGWQAVTVDGVPAGRLRPHARMRFRRD